jgi:hypothetical protein
MIALSPDTINTHIQYSSPDIIKENSLGYVCLLYQEIELYSCVSVFIVSGEPSWVCVFNVSGELSINTHTRDSSIS